MSSELNY